MRQTYMTADEVAQALNVSKSRAYNVIRQWNMELKEQGFFIKAGNVPKAYFEKKCYGYVKDD